MSGDAGDQAAVPWADDQHPLEAEESERQIESLRTLLGVGPKRVLELGCGAGRVLVPLAAAGHDVTGVDRDGLALSRCREQLASSGAAFTPRLIEADFHTPWPGDLGEFNAVCCLGNTMMTIVDVDEAVGLLRRSVASLLPGGFFVMDDCPGSFWPEVTEGHWQSGMSEDGNGQMVWEPDDAVFALRWGDNVDPESWTPKPGERRYRLWTMGALRLAAREAGFRPPGRVNGEGLLIMRLADV